MGGEGKEKGGEGGDAPNGNSWIRAWWEPCLSHFHEILRSSHDLPTNAVVVRYHV